MGFGRSGLTFRRVAFFAVVALAGGCAHRERVETIRDSSTGRTVEKALPTYKDDLKEASNMLPGLYQQYKAAGLPYELADFPKDKDVDDSDNAAPYFLSAWEKLGFIGQDQEIELNTKAANVKPFRAPKKFSSDSAEGAALRVESKDIKPVLAMISLGAAKPNLDYKFRENNYIQNFYVHLQDIQQSVRSFIRIECHLAENEASAEHGKLAAEHLNRAWKIVRLVGSSPHVDGVRFSIQCQSLVEDSLERCIEFLFPSLEWPTFVHPGPGMPFKAPTVASSFSYPGTDDIFYVKTPVGSKPAFDEFKAALELDPIHLDFKTDVLRRNVNVIILSRELDGLDRLSDQTQNMTFTPNQNLGQIFPTTVYGRAQVARELQFYLDNRKAYDDLNAHPVQAAESIDSAYDVIHDHGRSYEDLQIPDLKWEAMMMQESQDQRDCDLLLLAALQYKLDHGTWPASLTGLAPSVGDSQRFHFVRDLSAVQVYRLDAHPSELVERQSLDFRLKNGYWPVDVSLLPPDQKRSNFVFTKRGYSGRSFDVVASYPAIEKRGAPGAFIGNFSPGVKVVKVGAARSKPFVPGAPGPSATLAGPSAAHPIGSAPVVKSMPATSQSPIPVAGAPRGRK